MGSFRVTRGEKYNPMLKLNTSMVFREKEQKYRNIVRKINIIKINIAIIHNLINDKFFFSLNFYSGEAYLVLRTNRQS